MSGLELKNLYFENIYQMTDAKSCVEINCIVLASGLKSSKFPNLNFKNYFIYKGRKCA